MSLRYCYTKRSLHAMLIKAMSFEIKFTWEGFSLRDHGMLAEISLPHMIIHDPDRDVKLP